jgi:hypothetical protein
MLGLLLAVSISITVPDSAPGVFRDGPIRHFECFNIVRLADHARTMGPSADNVTAVLTSHCSKISGKRREVCGRLIPDKISFILAQLDLKTLPEDICTQLGFERAITRSRFMEKSTCISIMDQLKEDEKKKKSEGGGEPAKLPRLPGGALAGVQRRFFGAPVFCRTMETQERVSCQIVTRLALRKMKSELDAELDAAAICDKLQEMKWLNFSVPAKPEGESKRGDSPRL